MTGAEREEADDLRATLLEQHGKRSAEEAFRELVSFLELAVSLQARIHKFLNSNPVIGTIKFDDPAALGSGASKPSFVIEPTDDMASELAAVRALYAKGSAISGPQAHY